MRKAGKEIGRAWLVLVFVISLACLLTSANNVYAIDVDGAIKEGIDKNEEYIPKDWDANDPLTITTGNKNSVSNEVVDSGIDTDEIGITDEPKAEVNNRQEFNELVRPDLLEDEKNIDLLRREYTGVAAENYKTLRGDRYPLYYGPKEALEAAKKLGEEKISLPEALPEEPIY